MSMKSSANSHKVHSLVRLLGMDDPAFDALRLDAHIEAIVAQARVHIEAGDALRTRLLNRSQELGSQVDRSFACLLAQTWRAMG